MERSLSDIEYNYLKINEKINDAAIKSNRNINDIIFLAATKMVEPEYINYAISLGLKYIGENKVQELLSKYNDYDLNSCSLQFIGHLQTNKVKQIIDKVDLIQSVDSVKLATEISKESIKINKTTKILIEINIGEEDSKSGIKYNEAYDFLKQLQEIPNISINGLMCIPPICQNEQELAKYFDKMHNLFIDIKEKKLDNIRMDILSMGMSSDYELAIKHGANMVRIGSLLFGNRNYN